MYLIAKPSTTKNKVLYLKHVDHICFEKSDLTYYVCVYRPFPVR